MTVTIAFKHLDAIRNNRSDSADELIARVSEIGQWAAKQKWSKSIAKVLQECHHLTDRLEGGSGNGGVRLTIEG